MLSNSALNKCLEILDDGYELSPRLKKLRENFFSRKLSICAERAKIITESFKKTEGEPMILRRAKALDEILSKMTIYINDGDFLVGNMASVPRSAPIFPEFSVNWIENELNGNPVGFAERLGDAYQISEEAKEILLNEVIPYWKGKTHEDRVNALLPEETRIATKEVRGTEEDWIMTSGDGHTIPDYEKIIKKGINEILRETQEKIESLDVSDPEDLRKLAFYQAVIISNKAVINFAKRYAEKAKQLAKVESDEKRKEELLKISDICSHVPANPARNFYEAIQTMLFVNVPIQVENNGHSISFGRVDQYLYPYFKKDVEEGILTFDTAFKLLGCLWLKVTELAKLRDWENTVAFVGNPLFQNLTIGGQTLAGEDAVNELSYLALACTKKLRMTQPSLTLRYFNGTSETFLIEALKVVRKGGGMPSFFNDEVIIPSMLNIGYSYEDACNYGIVGCVEPAPHGKIGGRYGSGFPNFAKWVELAINGGKDPRTGHQPCPLSGDLTTFKNFDELMDAYKTQMEYYMKHHVAAANVVDMSWEELTPNPFLSSTIDCCIERGKEIKQGGAKYDITGGQNVGTACAANSLATLKKVLFEEKILTAEQIKHALDTNFEDNTTKPTGEEIRQILLNTNTKFGNDVDEVDMIANEIMTHYANKVMKCKNTRYGKGPIGGIFIPSTATVSSHVLTGKVVGATPDGRKAGEAISEGTSPLRGTDRKGPTAVMNSIAKVPNVLMPGGQLCNIKINPTTVANDEGLMRWMSLIKTLFEKKGMQIQFNIVSDKMLKDAKKHPEKYQDLIVRVAGFSSYFVILRPEVQDDIIARTEHALG